MAKITTSANISTKEESPKCPFVHERGFNHITEQPTAGAGVFLLDCQGCGLRWTYDENKVNEVNENRQGKTKNKK